MKKSSLANRAFLLFCCFRAVCALDGDVFVLQTVAWAKMAYTFAHHDTLAVSLKKTFDGKHPCGICKGISALLADSPQMDSVHLDGKVKVMQRFQIRRRLFAELKRYSYPPMRQPPRGLVIISPPEPPPRTA